MRRVTICVLILLAYSLSVSAQTLYGSGVAPEDALVRLLNISNDARMLELGAAEIQAESYGTLTDYFPVFSGMHFIEFQEDWIEFIAESGVYYTVVISDREVRIFTDQAHTNPAKAQLYFYNLTDEPGSLKVDADGTAVFSDIDPWSSAQMAINPLQISFALCLKNDKVETLPILPLSRGGSVSVFLIQNLTTGGFSSVYAEAEIGADS